ncbi:MAG: NAD-binding protein [Acidobacteria bacterium]|nr:NAD-binding protein [Acidobacteriota bacterium]
MAEVIVVGGGPTGMMLAGELALAGVDVEILERRPTADLVGSRAGGIHSRTIEILDQRGIADRFLAAGHTAQTARFGATVLDIGDLPTRHPYGLALWQDRMEPILAGWVDELGVPTRRGAEVVGVDQDEDGVEARLADGAVVRARYLVGADGGRSLVRRQAGIAFPGSEATRSTLIAEVEVAEEPPTGMRQDATGVHGLLVAVYGTDFGVHSPVWISRFIDATRQAAEYRRGRILLAGTSPDALLDTYGAERHPAGARALEHSMAQTVLQRADDRTAALARTVDELVRMDEPRIRIAALIHGLDVMRVFALLHDARHLLLNLGEPGRFDGAALPHRVQLVDARHQGPWELPVIGSVPPPTALLVRPDGHVAWVDEDPARPMHDALARWRAGAELRRGSRQDR